MKCRLLLVKSRPLVLMLTVTRRSSTVLCSGDTHCAKLRETYVAATVTLPNLQLSCPETNSIPSKVISEPPDVGPEDGCTESSSAALWKLNLIPDAVKSTRLLLISIGTDVTVLSLPPPLGVAHEMAE